MLLFPDPDTAFLDPFTAEPTLVLLCNVKDPVTGEAYSRPTRTVCPRDAAMSLFAWFSEPPSDTDDRRLKSRNTLSAEASQRPKLSQKYTSPASTAARSSR